MGGISKVIICCTHIKRYFGVLFILETKFIMCVILAALSSDIFTVEITGFYYCFTVSMKGQEKFETAPSLFFSRFP